MRDQCSVRVRIRAAHPLPTCSYLLENAAGADDAVDAREVTLPVGHEASRRAHHRFYRFRLSRAYFKYHFTSRGEPSRKVRGNLAIEVHPISTTLERYPWLKVAHFGRQRGELRLGDVRRIGYDQIEWLSLIFQRGETIALK